MRKKKKGSPVKIVFFLFICVIVLTTWGVSMLFVKNTLFPTEHFIKRQMTNENGTVATYLQNGKTTDDDLVSGREALSETLGLSMQYALAKDDEKAFLENYRLLMTYFISGDGMVYWKLTADGNAEVTTNATVDDLRIIGALLDAHERWRNRAYLMTGRKMFSYLHENNQRSQLFVDYFDAKLKVKSENVTLSYIDIDVLAVMGRYGELDSQVYQKTIGLLQNIPDEQLFYPKLYSISSGKFYYEDEINLLDQMLVGIQRNKIGFQNDKIYYFIKSEFKKNGKLFGRYHRKNKLPAVDYESPALYALAIQFALLQGDQKFAESLYQRMIMFRNNNRFSGYHGAYSIDGKKDTHIFDNLLPLIAEVRMQKIMDQ